MTTTMIVIGIVLGAVLGALVDWLIQTRLPNKPSRSSTIAIIATSTAFVIILTIVALQERGGAPPGSASALINTSRLWLFASTLLSLVVVFVGIRAIKSISIHIQSELFGARTEAFVVRKSQTPKPVARLIDTQGSGEATKNITVMGQSRVGRDPALSNIVIDDPTVSRLHCSIYYLDGRFWITDEGSHSGTYVNYQFVGVTDRHELKTGDRIFIGTCEFLFVRE